MANLEWSEKCSVSAVDYVSKEAWDKMNITQREDALLQAIKDPDDITEFVTMEFNELPSWITANMYE